jgi:hypothetical protein
VGCGFQLSSSSHGSVETVPDIYTQDVVVAVISVIIVHGTIFSVDEFESITCQVKYTQFAHHSVSALDIRANHLFGFHHFLILT